MNYYTVQELRAIAKVVSQKEGIKLPTIEFKAVRRGRARKSTNKITIPLWAIVESKKEYSLYYVIHELIHFIVDSRLHDEKFKTKERQLLKEYNIVPIYARAYPKELRDLEGNKICGRRGE